MVVDLQVYYSDNSCAEDGRPFKYRTRVTGDYRSRPYYLNWRMSYADCDERLFAQQIVTDLWRPGGGHVEELIFESLDNRFTAAYLIQPYFDVYASASARPAGIVELPASYYIQPSGIYAKDPVLYKEATTLYVIGGYLNKGMDWVWYTDTVLQHPIGHGKRLNIQPSEPTTYYVRAEGNGILSPFIEKSINVDFHSVNPEAITGIEKVCLGDSVVLRVVGGHLGLDAQWIWTSSYCNGARVGTGETLVDYPRVNTKYFVKAVGLMNTTECISFDVKVFDKLEDPIVVMSPREGLLCIGQKAEFEIDNFLVNSDAVWSWYTDTTADTPLTTGAFTEFYPQQTTTYYVRGVGFCNSTRFFPYTFTVHPKSSIEGARIIAPDTVYRWHRITLHASGGIPGKDAAWKWFKDSCGGNGNALSGAGDSVQVYIIFRKHFYARLSGLCNETPCVETFVKPIKSHFIENRYAARNNKWLAWGAGAGTEWFNYNDISVHTLTTFPANKTVIDTPVIGVQGLGVKGEVSVYPLIKEWATIGFTGSYAVGTSALIFTSELFDRKYKYKRVSFQYELSSGIRPVKAVFKQAFYTQQNHMTLDFKNSDKKENYTYSRNLAYQTVYMGLRFGRYYNTKARSSTLDLMYTLTTAMHPEVTKSTDLLWNNRYWGAGICWWHHNSTKIQFDYISNARYSERKTLKPDPARSFFLLSVVFCRNWFY